MLTPVITALSASPEDLAAFADALSTAGFTVDQRTGCSIDQRTRTVVAYPLNKIYASYTLWANQLGAQYQTLVLADAVSAAIR